MPKKQKNLIIVPVGEQSPQKMRSVLYLVQRMCLETCVSGNISLGVIDSTTPPVTGKVGIYLLPYAPTRPVRFVVQVSPKEAYSCSMKVKGGLVYKLHRLLKQSQLFPGDFMEMKPHGFTPKGGAVKAAPTSKKAPRPYNRKPLPPHVVAAELKALTALLNKAVSLKRQVDAVETEIQSRAKKIGVKF